jgi:hypothetical protein
MNLLVALLIMVNSLSVLPGVRCPRRHRMVVRQPA